MKKFIALLLTTCMMLSTVSIALGDEIVENEEATIIDEDNAEVVDGQLGLNDVSLEEIDGICDDTAEVAAIDGECIESGDLEFDKNYVIERMTRGQSAKYKFTLNESGAVSVAISRSLVADGGWEPYIGIFNSADEEVWATDLENENDTLTWDLLAGDYYLQIWTNDTFLNAWKFTFSAEFEGSGETISEYWTDKNDTITTATKYSIGDKVKGYFADNEERDVYKAKIAKPGYLTIKVDSRMPSMGLRIYDSQDRVSYDYGDIKSGNRVEKIFVPSGTYYFEAYKSNYKVGNYTLSTSLKGLPAVTIKSAKANTTISKRKIARSLKMTWKKNSDADGYQVQVSNKSNFSSKKTYEYENNKSVATIKNYKFAKGKKYYVRIREYKTMDDGTRAYSEWSKVKSVKFTK